MTAVRSATSVILLLVLSAPLPTAAGTPAAAVATLQPAATPAAPSSAFYAASFSRTPSVPAMTALGRALFFDPALSASGRMACATCHDPRFAYGPADSRAVAQGGARLDRAGLRAIPSLRYTQNIPAFSEQPLDEE